MQPLFQCWAHEEAPRHSNKNARLFHNAQDPRICHTSTLTYGGLGGSCAEALCRRWAFISQTPDIHFEMLSLLKACVCSHARVIARGAACALPCDQAPGQGPREQACNRSQGSAHQPPKHATPAKTWRALPENPRGTRGSQTSCASPCASAQITRAIILLLARLQPGAHKEDKPYVPSGLDCCDAGLVTGWAASPNT